MRDEAEVRQQLRSVQTRIAEWKYRRGQAFHELLAEEGALRWVLGEDTLTTKSKQKSIYEGLHHRSTPLEAFRCAHQGPEVPLLHSDAALCHLLFIPVD